MSHNIKNLAYFEGKIIPVEYAKVSIQTHALQYGTSVFGGIRGYYNSEKNNVFVFRIQDHFKRLLRSAKIMQLQTNKSYEELSQIALELIRESGYKENIYLRPFIYTSALQLSPRFHDVKTEFALYILPLNDYLDTKKGLKTVVSSWRRIDDSTIPSMSKAAGGYVNSALAKSEAVQQGMDEAIFLDAHGYVSEGSAENIFIVRDEKLITPDLDSSILEGITRRSIIELALELGMTVEKRRINRSELYIADEAFFCGTGVQVAWISEIDRRKIGDGEIGPIATKLQELFFQIVTGKSTLHTDWLSPVY